LGTGYSRFCGVMPVGASWRSLANRVCASPTRVCTVSAYSSTSRSLAAACRSSCTLPSAFPSHT
jgi:hypothetical protein